MATVGSQLCCTNEPPPQMNSEKRYSPLARISAELAAFAVSATIMPASTTDTGSSPRRQVSERIKRHGEDTTAKRHQLLRIVEQ